MGTTDRAPAMRRRTSVSASSDSPDVVLKPARSCSSPPLLPRRLERWSSSTTGATRREITTATSRGKRADVLHLVAASALSAAVMLFVMWRLDMFSSGRWEGYTSTRVVFEGDDSFVALRKALLDEKGPDTIVAFYSEQCAYCKKIRQPVLKVANEYVDLNFVAVRLGEGSEENTQLARTFGVTHVPSLYFVKRRQTLKDWHVQRIKYVGGAQLPQMRNFINTHMAAGTHHADVPDPARTAQNHDR